MQLLAGLPAQFFCTTCLTKIVCTIFLKVWKLWYHTLYLSKISEYCPLLTIWLDNGRGFDWPHLLFLPQKPTGLHQHVCASLVLALQVRKRERRSDVVDFIDDQAIRSIVTFIGLNGNRWTHGLIKIRPACTYPHHKRMKSD